MDKRKGTTKSSNESTKPKILKQEYKITSKKKDQPTAKNTSSQNSKGNRIMISKKFTIEIATKIIQRNFRLYLKRIKSHPSYEMKQMLRKKKLGLLQSYNIMANKEDSKKGLPVYNEANNNPKINESNKKERIINDHTPPLIHQINEYNNINADNKKNGAVSIDKKVNSNNQYQVNDIDDDYCYDEKHKMKEYIQRKEEEKNDDMVNIEKEVNDYIDKQNESINQLIGQSESNKECNTNTHNNNNNNDNNINNSTKKIKEAFIEEEDNHIENVYERIYKEMIKEKRNTKAIKDNKDITKPSKSHENNDSQQVKKNKPTKMISSNKDSESIDLNEDIHEEDKESIVLNDDKKSIHNTSSIPEKNESINISQRKNDNDIVQSKKEIYTRLTKYLDNSDQSITRDNNDPLYQPKIPSLAQQTNNLNTYITDTQLQADNLGLNLELKEAKKTIETMSSIISDLKDQLQKKDDNMTKALLRQKEELDATLNRQNTLMESLFSEKKKYENQIGELQEKLNQIEKSSYKKLQSIKESYELETKKNKEAWFQAEKLRRKKWEEQKVKEIKELTAKGLEPEIEKIIANHKAEISHFEEEYTLNLKTQKERLLDEYDLKFSELKHRLTKEKEEVIEHEKNLAVQRLRNQSERLEEEISEERRRWNSKMQNEISRLESLREKDKKIYEDQISKLEERNSNNVFSNEEFYKKKIDDMKKNYDEKIASEIALLKANMEKENERALTVQKSSLEAKYKEMKLEFMKDRDKQINIVIEKLGEETMAERKKNQIECEKKSNEKNLALIEENCLIKKQLNDLTLKLQAETKNRANLEENLDSMTKRLNDKENDLNKKEKQLNEITSNYSNVSEKLGGLTREFNKERMNLEIEMKSELQKGEAELLLLNNKLQTAQKLYENQKMEIEAIHRKEVDEIGYKIEKSLKNRDEIIKKLQDEIQFKEITIQKYEEMLNQQRKEFFSK